MTTQLKKTGNESNKETDSQIVGWSIRVRGTVQGVGFRPTVYKLALDMGVTGTVLNDGEGVVIAAFAPPDQLTAFVQAIDEQSPPLARIETIEHSEIAQPNGAYETIPAVFTIEGSEKSSTGTNVAADAATCTECRDDTLNAASQQQRRFRYPFTNCTHCGPRLSIIKSIPYDRSATSMSVFKMCGDCLKEYQNPLDRRFHAQPNACHACGPKAWLKKSDGQAICLEELSQLDWVDAAAALIQRGEIVAVKGIGGFHLACDATNETAVAKLRARKKRYHKPFALMAGELDVIKQYCFVNAQEEKLLTSTAAPIVVMATKEGTDIAPSVTPRQNTLGFMLPYTPLHSLLFERLQKPVVLTSGNRSDEPQCIDNDEARDRLAEIADYFLLHDREIVNRLDDSVVRVINGKATIMRRARGYAPIPIILPEGFQTSPSILAMGGELKNTFCLATAGRAVLSQHMGDLEELKSYNDYKNNLKLYTQCFQHQPCQIAVDMHPEYLSSKLGRAMARSDHKEDGKDDDNKIILHEIQHHHAHIASCLADNNWPLDGGPVMGVALDGSGYGCDGTFWGGEFLLCDYSGFERLGTFKPVAMPGGAQAIREPWRNTYAHIMAEMGWPSYKLDYEELELTAFLESKPLSTLQSMLKSNLNSPLSSSCGRLFDAVAAAMNICREQAFYEGQAAVEMEALVDLKTLKEESENLSYRFDIPSMGGKGLPYIEPLAAWQALLGDILRGTAPGIMAARFHKGLARAIVDLVQKLCTRDDQRWLNTVALSGGVFQNKILLEEVSRRLQLEGFNVLSHNQVPPNDGGLALGQAVISAATTLKQENKNVSWHTWPNS